MCVCVLDFLLQWQMLSQVLVCSFAARHLMMLSHQAVESSSCSGAQKQKRLPRQVLSWYALVLGHVTAAAVPAETRSSVGSGGSALIDTGSCMPPPYVHGWSMGLLPSSTHGAVLVRAGSGRGGSHMRREDGDKRGEAGGEIAFMDARNLPR